MRPFRCTLSVHPFSASPARAAFQWRFPAHAAPLTESKVPLLILDPTHELPNVYDAGVRSSIDLAPSLLHLLGFPRKRANSFLGTSLFEVRSGENGLAAGAIRPDSYLFEQETLHINLPRMRPPELLDGLSVFIDNLYRLDTTQRIWPADESSAKR